VDGADILRRQRPLTQFGRYLQAVGNLDGQHGVRVLPLQVLDLAAQIHRGVGVEAAPAMVCTGELRGERRNRGGKDEVASVHRHSP
jgi:hypothetical protein